MVNVAAEVPELSEAMLKDLETEEPEVPAGTEVPEPPEIKAEAPEEAEKEAPAEEPEEDVIATLPKEVVDEIIRRRGQESEVLAEQLRRERQSAADTVGSEQERLRAQQEDMNRILETGKAAIAQIGSVVNAAQKGIEDGTARLDTGTLYKAVDQYRDAWVAGQAMTWNRELQEAFTGQGIVTATFGEAEADRLSNALKASNRANTRAPLLKEMFGLLTEKALEQGYQMAVVDLNKLGAQQALVEGKKDGLRKLQAAIPPKQPGGATAKSSTDQDTIRRHGAGEDVSEKEVQAARKRLGLT
jgi:hypothetical protein